MTAKSKSEKIRVGISIGDTNGVGMEVIIKTLLDPRIFDICTIVVYGSQKVAQQHRKILEIADFSFNVIEETSDANKKQANLLSCWSEDIELNIGTATETGGKYAFESLISATEDLASNNIDVLVTAPINKHNMPKGDFDFPGHTEFLADYANVEHPLMILVNDGLRVALVTGHIPVDKIKKSLNKELILDKIEVFNKSLHQDFGIQKPKIAVLGLNPHAGDNGLLGDEEKEIIIPAIEAAKQKGIVALGPYPADGFFGSGNMSKFDGILAMYHDQGLVPFKTLAFGEGVNYTAGLPIVRTSPDHGTAYDIAGKNIASESSFRSAIYLACDIYKRRKEHRVMNGNPLEIGYASKRSRDKVVS